MFVEMSHQAGFTQGSTIFFNFQAWGQIPSFDEGPFCRGGKKHPPSQVIAESQAQLERQAQIMLQLRCPKNETSPSHRPVFFFWNQGCLGMFLKNIVGRKGRALFSIFDLWFLIMLLLIPRQTGIISDGFNNDGGPENMTSLLSVKEPC